MEESKLPKSELIVEESARESFERLLEIVAEKLLIKGHLSLGRRKFILALSGGSDSMVLSFLVHHLLGHEHDLEFVHIHYGLRGKSSDLDEQLVRDWGAQLERKVHLIRALAPEELAPETGIQEWAREVRLGVSKTFDSEWDWIEAHHADDQVETFFLRLFRGAGPQGLSSMKEMSEREGRRIFRPLLQIRKSDLRKIAAAFQIPYREDESNFDPFSYDRNFIRNEVLPKIDSRFPSARRSILRSIELFREEALDFDSRYDTIAQNIVASWAPLIWDWRELLRLSPFEQKRFVHRFFQEHLQTTLYRDRLLELGKFILSQAIFSFNAPQGLIVQGAWFKGRKEVRFFSSSKSGKVPLLLMPSSKLSLEALGSELV